MATRTEGRLGEAKDLDATYTLVGTVAGSTTWNLHLNVTNLLTTPVKFRAFVADNSWSSGLPSGSTKKGAIAFDAPILAGRTEQWTGIIMLTTEKLVVWSDTTDGLDVIASGVAIT